MPARCGGKLLVLGNIAAGKSGLARTVAHETGWPRAGIDDARRRFGDGSAAGEAQARAHFLAQAEQRLPAVLECTGGGPFTPLLRLALRRSGLPWAVLLVRTPAPECLRRAGLRGLDVPYPDFGVPLDEVVVQVERELDRLVGTAWPAPLCTLASRMATRAAVAEALLAEFGRAGGAGALLRELGVTVATAEALRARLLLPAASTGAS